MFQEFNGKLRLQLVTPLLVCFLLLLPVFISGIGGYFPVLLPITIFSSYIIGEVIFYTVGFSQFKLSVSRVVASILLGSLLCSLTLFLFPRNGLAQLTVCCLLSVLSLFLFRRKIVMEFSLSSRDIVALVIAALLSLFLTLGGEMTSLTLPVQAMLSTSVSDQFFFTANVVTLRNGSIFNAVYEQGSALNFHSLGFFIPAWWANILDISSHQALYGIAMPFYKILSFLLFYELSTIFVDDKTAKKYGNIVAAMGLVIVLAPLHPLYLLKADVKNFIFSGMGYLLPTGNPTYTFAIPMCLLSLFLFLKIGWRTSGAVPQKVLFTVLFSLLAISKLPIFFCSFVFIATIVLKRILFDREKITAYLPYGLSVIILGGILFKVFLSNDAASRTSIKYGYLVGRFAQFLNMADTSILTHLMILLLTFVVFALWIGIRFIGLISLIRSREKMLSELVVGSFFCLAVAILMNLFLHIDLVDKDGNVLRDGTFDAEQFIRSSFYILTVVSAIGIMNFVTRVHHNPLLKTVVVVLLVFWSGASISALAAHSYNSGEIVRNDWYDENFVALKSGKFDNGLILVHPFEIYGILLSSSDFGSYWCAQAQGDGCYNSTLKNAYRWDMYKKLVSDPSLDLIQAMKRENVRYIIATPSDEAGIKRLPELFPGKVGRVAGSNWIYELM
jgi:hypothetical protein